MAIERTLSIIKPDAVAKNAIGQIIARFENAGLKVIGGRLVHLSRAQAEQFYAVHSQRPFFNDLVEFMISGPVFVQVLEGENAIQKNRDLMGATDPKQAEPGTILEATKQGIQVATGDGILNLISLQPAGKKAMSAQDLLNSRREWFVPGNRLV